MQTYNLQSVRSGHTTAGNCILQINLWRIVDLQIQLH
jgi:hypothetical protein